MNYETLCKLVKASGVSSGEMILVHFWGEDADKAIANHFLSAVAAQGATPLLLQQSRTINRSIFSAAAETCFDERYFEKLSGFDAVLDVFSYQPIVLGYPLEDQQLTLYRKYISTLFYKLMECKRFTQIRIPTVANAEESGLEPEDYIQRMEAAYDVDYDAIHASCLEKAQQFQNAQRVAIHTGENCVLNMVLTGRAWHIDAGDGDLPCGEIYIAPLEDKTNGMVYFPVLWIDDRKYESVTLAIKDGKVINSNLTEVGNYFVSQPEENRTICELGIGMNPNVTELCGYTVLNEKMCGTFHIAVGSNTMFGGCNEANCHIDFVGQGKVEVLE